MNTETIEKNSEKPNENNEIGVEPVVELQDKVSMKPIENYSYRGGTALVGFTQALKLTGTSRATLHRYTQNGKISFETNADGHKIYQVVELERVFGKLKTEEPEKESSKEQERNQTETVKPDHETTLKIALLEQENRFLKEQNENLQQNTEDLRRAMLMLTHKPKPQAVSQPMQPTPPPKGFLARLFGGNG